MEIADILEKDRVVLSLKATSKRQALEELAGHAARATGLPSQQIFDILMERERLGTTGVGGGIAIPHGKIPQLERLFSCFARLDKPVEFDAIDGQPVDLLFLLLAPESAGADHLKAITRVSRLLRDSLVCEKLRSAPTSDHVYGLLAEECQFRAA